jgi:hypothetical protein
VVEKFSLILSEKKRMVLVAVGGAAIGWITYELIYFINPITEYRATTSWLIHFTIGVARQHGLHRWLTFTEKTPYWMGLGKAYMFYSAAAICGGIANYILTEVFHINHHLAWACCLGMTASLSLLFLKKIVFTSNQNEHSDSIV